MFDTQKFLSRSVLNTAIVMAMMGCSGGDTLNTETAVYQPEARPLNVIAPENIEVKPGDAVTLTSRLVGTVTDQILEWSQISGASIVIPDVNAPTLSFVVPDAITSDKLVFQVSALQPDRTPVMGEDNLPLTDTVEVTVFDPDSVILLDVSDSAATLSGASLVQDGDDQYVPGANNDIHTADLEPGESVIFNIDNASGFFTLNLRYLIPSDYGGKVANVVVNGIVNELSLSATGQWEEIRVGVIKLEEGANTIEVGGGWSYYRIDTISLIPAAEPAAPLPVAPTLVNENASESAIELMTFITDNYISKTISGQTEFPNGDGAPNELTESNIVTDATGDDAPAIIAFDYMRYSPSRVENGEISGSLTEDMIAHHRESNVVLSPLWHWNAPMHVTNSSEQPWWRGFYADATTFDLAQAMANPDSPEYQAILSDIDVIAAELKKFADEDIPLLWRPIHEADGDWFWWSTAGGETYRELWILMYERMTQVHELNNLIWVFTYSHFLNEDYYPGNDYVDIVGFDGYDGNNDQNPFVSAFNTLKDWYNGQKVLALTETGAVPDVSVMHANDAWWSYFVTWNGGNDVGIGPGSMAPDIIDSNYAFDGVINLADLPGGITPVGPGVFENFDGATGFSAQVNWSDASAVTANTALVANANWAAEGVQGLTATMDLSAITEWPEFPSTVIQTYPNGGFDVSQVSTLMLSFNAINAGEGVTGKLWLKHGEDQIWVDSGAIAVTEGGTSVSVDVSDYDSIAGLGVQFEGFDVSSSEAQFAVDQISFDGAVVAGFEQNDTGFHAQWDWSTTSGEGISNDWSAENAMSFVFSKDLSQKTDWGEFPSTVIQNYPDGGIDVSAASALSLNVNTSGVGENATGKLWIKHGADQIWVDAGAIAIPEGGTELSIDVAEYDLVAGFGVQYEGFDLMASDAKFYLDNVRVDDTLLYDFEQAGQWHSQANWATTPGTTLTDSWGENGSKSIALNMDLSSKTDWGDNPSTVIQIYPGINISGVSTLRLMAHSSGAGANVTGKLWVKHGEGAEWADAGPIPLSGDGTMLEIDVSAYSFLAGWGVQFEGFDVMSDDAHFFVDSVEFVE